MPAFTIKDFQITCVILVPLLRQFSRVYPNFPITSASSFSILLVLQPAALPPLHCSTSVRVASNECVNVPFCVRVKKLHLLINSAVWPVPPLDCEKLLDLFLAESLLDWFCRVSPNHLIWRHILHHMAVICNYCTVPNCHTRHDGCILPWTAPSTQSDSDLADNSPIQTSLPILTLRHGGCDAFHGYDS